MSPRSKLTMLNGMAGPDFAVALDRQRALGIDTLDLKDGIFGKAVEDLSAAEAAQATEMIAARGMSVHCLSTGLGNVSIELGEMAWCAANVQILDRILAAAGHLRPRTIRIVVAFSEQGDIGVPFSVHAARHPWIGAAYGELVARIVGAGYGAVIENEAHRCIVTGPDDAIALFATLPQPPDVSFIWDIQNMWQMGYRPDLAALSRLLPILSAVHLKGGIAGANGLLSQASGLRHASWDVLGIAGTAIASGKVPVICLNPSHGDEPADWDVWDVVRDDIAYLRENLAVA